jgi:predicted anti-sigma-YlaC factor YlaD
MNKELIMNCREIQKNFVYYSEGLLSSQKMQEIRSHLEECKVCSLLLTKVSNTYSVFDLVKVPELPADLTKKIEARLKKHHIQVSFERFTINRSVSGIAATVLVLIGIGLGILVGGKIENIPAVSKNVGLNEAIDNYAGEYTLIESGQSLEALLTNE